MGYKGKPVYSWASIALAKIQDILKKYSVYQNGVISGYGVSR